MRLLTLTLPVLALLAFLSPASAQETQYFLKLDGVPGDSADEHHANEIDIISASFSVLQPQMQRFVGSLATAARTEIQPVTLTKFIDKSSPMLFLKCATAKNIPTAVITARKAGEGGRDFYTITLSDVWIASLAQSAGEGGVLESVSLSFSKIAISFTPQNPNGSLGTPITATFDIKANKAFAPRLDPQQ
jgi:type VI secretion system secreted protein Hcp